MTISTRGLIEEMQRNLDEALARASETERQLSRVLEEYIFSYEKEMEAPALHHGQGVADDAKQRHPDVEPRQRH